MLDTHANSGYTKPKRLVLNASQSKGNSRSGPVLMSAAEDEQFRKNTQTIGKVVFLKDRDIEMNAFERDCCLWASHFYLKMHALCARKPRFSEMRPLKYNI